VDLAFSEIICAREWQHGLVLFLFSRMPEQQLAHFPYVIVRIGCEVCARRGRYRLARLAAKYGAEIDLYELLARLTADCGASNPRHPLHRECQARFVDLDPPAPSPGLANAAASNSLRREEVMDGWRVETGSWRRAL
jgi:hypothetical protein